MKKLLLLSLLFIGCNNAQNSSVPMPNEIPLLEIPSDNILQSWANKIDTIWTPENFKEYNLILELRKNLSSEDYNMLMTKYKDLTWQSYYDYYIAIRDSAYYTFENLNKYESVNDYMMVTFPRLLEFVLETDSY